jgi:flavodoxin
MEILYVFYSRTGNNRILAKEICKSLGCALEGVETEENLSTIPGIMLNGFKSLLGIMPKITQPKEDPSKYDLVIIGTPAWAGSLPSPMRAYLIMKKWGIKRYAIASLSSKGDNPKMLGQVRQLMKKEPVAVLEISMPKTEKPSMNEVIDADYLQKEWKGKIEEFISEIK